MALTANMATASWLLRMLRSTSFSGMVMSSTPSTMADSGCAWQAAGQHDSGGLEIHDIFDAVESLKKRFSGRIDPDRIGIQGWSGGGGNVFRTREVAC